MNLIDANQLFLEGQIALAEIEANGIRIDEPFLDKSIAKVKAKIKKIQERMKEDEVWKAWQNRYKATANIGSRPQLGVVLFDEMRLQYPKTSKTKSGRYATDESVLSKVDIPFVRDFTKGEGLKKLLSTYLNRLKDETVDGFYHPEHHLNTVTTYRSSADGIQTIPTRDEKAKKIIRSCFIPRENHALVACDFSAHEFRIAASYWQDKAMMEYASDPTKDIHRDVAAKLFCCKKEQVTKELRYLGKNGFVFPRLYGSWYCNIAPQIWPELKGKTIEDKSVFEWLNDDAGISELGPCDPDNQPPSEGTFEYKVKDVQDWFDNKFYEFASKREDRYQKYLKRGWFKHPTGFVQSGLYTKKDTMNHPIQGSAFHCLLWTAIRVVKKIKKRKMQSKPIAEVHDEILADCPLVEVQDYLNMVKGIIADLPNHWKWIKVPLAMEAKWSTESWAQMKVIEEKNGVWQ